MNHSTLRMTLSVLVLTLTLIWLWPRPAQAQTCNFPVTVSNEDGLNAAIACYNSRTSPGEYQITLGDNILLTASTTPIDNDTDEVSLLIDGATHRVDGQGIFRVRPFTIDYNTVVTITTITVTGGHAETFGGGIYNAGTLSLVNSTISSNTAGGAGGGIYNSGTLSLLNSTISSNTAAGGGGVWNEGSLSVQNSTISSNAAEWSGGILNWAGKLALANTIIANNTGGNCFWNGGSVTDGGHNLIEGSGANTCGLTATPANGNIIGQPAHLGPLQDNGGPTLTHALLDGSPAIDAGDPAVCADPATVNNRDQRGVSRPQGAQCDIGAFEYRALPTLTIAKAATPQEGTDFAFGLGPASDPAAPLFQRAWGGTGTGNGLFLAPWGLAVDSLGHVYVADTGINNRIQKFDAHGNFLTQWSGQGGANSPRYLAVDRHDNLYVLFGDSEVVQKFTSDGTFLFEIDLNYPGVTPESLALDPADQLYVFDKDNDQLLRFAPDSTPLPPIDLTAAGSVPFPTGIAVDSEGNLYLADAPNSRIVKLDAAGTVLQQWDDQGTGANVFAPWRIAIDGAGLLYVSDLLNQRVVVFDRVGNLLGAWGTPGTGPGQFQEIHALALNHQGAIYVSDLTQDRIQQFVLPRFALDDAAPDDQDGIADRFTYAGLPPGEYLLNELLPSHWLLTGIECGGGATPATVDGSTVHLTLDYFDEVTCTFHNLGQGEITFVKQVTGGAATPDAWRFAIQGGPQDIAHNQAVTLTVGSYTVNETGPDGYTLTAASGVCALVNGQIHLTVPLGGGTCTLASTRDQGQITFVKDADGGAANDDDWTFRLVSGPAGATLLTNLAHEQVVTLDTGSYVVAESGPAGYHLHGATGVCQVVNGQIQLTVTTAGGICEVDNHRDTGEITFVKQVLGGSATPADWRFTLTSGPAGATLPTGLTHNSRRELETGLYTLREVGPAGYTLQSAAGACKVVDGQIQLTVTTAGGTCTIVNTQAAVQVNEFFATTWVREGQVSGEGGEACIWLALTAAPSGPVTLSATPRHGQVTLDKSTITLDATNWNRFDLAQRDNLLCLRAVDDQLDDGEQTQCKEGLSERFGGVPVPDQACGDQLDFVDLAVVNSADPAYGAFTPFVANTPEDLDANPASIDVLVQDNDTASVILTPAHGVAELDEDGTPVAQACYWATLTSQPTQPVTIHATGDSQVTVTPATVTLDASNWQLLDPQQTANRFCVAPVDDAIDEPATPHCADRLALPIGGAPVGQVCGDHLGVVSHTVTSGDSNYHATSAITVDGPDVDGIPSTLDVLLRDDDVVGLRFMPGNLSVVEGGTVQYQVVLTSQPAAEVTVNNGNDTVTFTPQSWNQPQHFTVTAPDNNLVDGPRSQPIPHTTASSDPAYDGLTPTLPLLVLDNDSASLQVLLLDATDGQLTVAEGGQTARYTLQLTAQPTADLVVTVQTDGQVTVNPPQLTFTRDNWNQPQTVVVSAVDDQRAEPPVLSLIEHQVMSQGAANGQLAPVVKTRVLDNDVAGVELSAPDPFQISEGNVAAAATASSYTIRLTSQPTAVVTIQIAGEGVTVQPATLTFTPDNWHQPQTVVVTALDDNIDEGDRQVTLLSHSVRSADPAYHGLSVPTLAVTILDDDSAGVLITPTLLTVTVGANATYQVVLTSQPTGPVQIDLHPTGPFRVVSTCESGEAERICLTFTPDNWQQPQTVTLTGLAAGTGHIAHTVVSNDALYAAQPAATVTVVLRGAPSSEPEDVEPTPTQSIFLPLVTR
jgi:hypothetical protein